MRRRIWITKNWELASCIIIWFEKPIWYPNLKKPCAEDSGYWGDENGNLSGCPLGWDAFKKLFKVSFHKKIREGFIAERIISISKSKRGEK